MALMEAAHLLNGSSDIFSGLERELFYETSVVL
jgi:hypothetical protein